MDNEAVKKAYNGYRDLFTLCLRRGLFANIEENLQAFSDMETIGVYIRDQLKAAEEVKELE